VGFSASADQVGGIEGRNSYDDGTQFAKSKNAPKHHLDVAGGVSLNVILVDQNSGLQLRK